MALEYESILKVTEDFYAKAKIDFIIGYHFRVIDDFDTHIPRIADFWTLQLTGKLKNKTHLPFNLIEIHKTLNARKGEYGRWVVLFTETLDQAVLSGQLTQDDKKKWLEKINLFKQKIMQLVF